MLWSSDHAVLVRRLFLSVAPPCCCPRWTSFAIVCCTPGDKKRPCAHAPQWCRSCGVALLRIRVQLCRLPTPPAGCAHAALAGFASKTSSPRIYHVAFMVLLNTSIENTRGRRWRISFLLHAWSFVVRPGQCLHMILVGMSATNAC